MKHVITVKQFKELNQKGRDKLIKYVGYYPPLLSIGEMIEFLGDDWFKSPGFDMQVKNKDLCDTLWKPVKEKLEK